MASCCSHADILVVVAAPSKRFSIDIISQGRLVVTQGVGLSLKDCATSTKPGSQVIFFSASFSTGAETHSEIVCLTGVVWVEVVGAVVVVGMARGL